MMLFMMAAWWLDPAWQCDWYGFNWHQENIIEAYVVEKPGSPGTITDFVRWEVSPITCLFQPILSHYSCFAIKTMMTLFSFYTLPSTVMNHPTHSSIKVKSNFFSNIVKLQFLSCRRLTHSTTCPLQHLGLIWWEMLWWPNKQIFLGLGVVTYCLMYS